MTLPRQVLAGASYLITRRCANRRFLLKPSAASNNAFEYCLARACSVSGVKIHAYCAMSNHYHLVITDVHGHLPVFMRQFNRLLSMCLKHLHQWQENVWSSRSYNAVELPSAEGVFEKMLYCVTNPVSAGLVHTVRKWPGAWGYASDNNNKPKTIQCPKVFFNQDNPSNKHEQLRLHFPQDALAQSNKDEQRWQALFEQALSQRQHLIRTEFKHKGKGFVGAFKVRKTHPHYRPPSLGKMSMRQREVPKIATQGDPTLGRSMKTRLREFWRSYKEAYDKWKSGRQKIVFPAGTWWVVFQAGAKRQDSHEDWRMSYG